MVTLYSVMDTRVIESAKSGNVVASLTKGGSEPWGLEAYAWMQQQVQKLSPEVHLEPLSVFWAWTSISKFELAKQCKTDSEIYRERGLQGALVKLRIPSGRLVVTGFQPWHQALMNLPAETMDKWCKECDSGEEVEPGLYEHIVEEVGEYQWETMPERFKRVVIASWENLIIESPYIISRRQRRSIGALQACFGVLKFDDIVAIEYL